MAAIKTKLASWPFLDLFKWIPCVLFGYHLSYIHSEWPKQAPRVHLLSKAQWPTIKEETSAFATRFCAKSLDKPIDKQGNQIESHISSMLDRHVPMKLTRHDQPWLTTELKQKIHKKERLYNKWKRWKSPTTECTDEIHQHHPIWRHKRKIQKTILVLYQVTAPVQVHVHRDDKM